jgi:pimeloyl-ACP methyl ester carboxylesterase
LLILRHFLAILRISLVCLALPVLGYGQEAFDVYVERQIGPVTVRASEGNYQIVTLDEGNSFTTLAELQAALEQKILQPLLQTDDQTSHAPLPPALFWPGSRALLEKVLSIRSPWAVTPDTYNQDHLVRTALDNMQLELPQLVYNEPNAHDDVSALSLKVVATHVANGQPFTLMELLPVYRLLRGFKESGKLANCSAHLQQQYALMEIALRADFIASYEQVAANIEQANFSGTLLEQHPQATTAELLFAAVKDAGFSVGSPSDVEQMSLRRLTTYVRSGLFSADQALLILMEEGGEIDGQRYQLDARYRSLVKVGLPEIAGKFDEAIKELDWIDQRAAELAIEIHEKNRQNVIYPAATGSFVRVSNHEHTALSLTADFLPDLSPTTYQKAPFWVPQDQDFEQAVRKHYDPDFRLANLDTVDIFSIYRAVENFVDGFSITMGSAHFLAYEIPRTNRANLSHFIKATPQLSDASWHRAIELFLTPHVIAAKIHTKHFQHVQVIGINPVNDDFAVNAVDLETESLLFTADQWDYFWAHLDEYERDDRRAQKILVTSTTALAIVGTGGIGGLSLRALGSLALRGVIVHEAGVVLVSGARSLQQGKVVWPTIENLTLDALNTGALFAAGGWAGKGLQTVFPSMRPLLANTLGFASAGFGTSVLHGESLAQASVGAVKLGTFALFGGAGSLVAGAGKVSLLQSGFRVYLVNGSISAAQGAVEYKLGGYVDMLGYPAKSVSEAVAMNMIGSLPMDLMGARTSAQSMTTPEGPAPKEAKILQFPIAERRAQAALEVAKLSATGTDGLPESYRRANLTVVKNNVNQSGPGESGPLGRQQSVRTEKVTEYNEDPNWKDKIRAEEIPTFETIRIVPINGLSAAEADGMLVMLHGNGMDISHVGSMRKWARLFGEVRGSRRNWMWTQGKLRDYPNDTRLAVEAIALPAADGGPDMQQFPDLENVVDWFGRYLQAKKTVQPDKPLFVMTRSSSAVFASEVNRRFPDLIDGLVFVSPSFAGDPTIITQEVAGAHREVALHAGAVYADKAPWVQRMLEQGDWRSENFGNKPTLILTADGDLEVCDLARIQYDDMAARLPNVKHYRFSSDKHDFLSVENTAGRDEALRGLKLLEDMFHSVVTSK